MLVSRQNRYFKLLVILAIAGLILAGSSAASAVDSELDAEAIAKAAVEDQDEGLSPEVQSYIDEVGADVVDNDDRLNELKTWILDQPEAAMSGYVDQVNDAVNLSAELLWYETDPFLETVQHHAAEMGIVTTVQQRSMSLEQIEDAYDRIWDAAPAIAEQGFDVKAIVGVEEEDHGLIVQGVYNSGSAKADTDGNVSPEALEQRAALKRLVEASAQVPVTLEENDVTLDATRQNDYSPFYAGGYMITSAGKTCSAGFAVRKDGQNYVTTARHCRGS